jgi:glycosyltransferase involved in cell wall biosynthesis
VVVQDSGGTLRRNAEHPRLATLPFVSDFAAELARCDLVVWPSRWEAYIAAHSGVVSECIATGVPVVLPSGCLPADLAGRFGTGVFFHDYSRDGVLEAVDEAAERFPAIVRAARAGAAAWRGQNGVDRLVDWIEARFSERR